MALISSALHKVDCDDNQLKWLYTCMDSPLPVQEGFSVMTLMIEQETMDQNLFNSNIYLEKYTITRNIEKIWYYSYTCDQEDIYWLATLDYGQRWLVF